MNYELLDPFSQDYPDTLCFEWYFGHATALRFNKRGDVLAVGIVNGSVKIIDLVSRRVLRLLKGHTRIIQSLCWSADDRYLLTAARDWKAVLWDLNDGSIVYSVKLAAPIWAADLAPSDIYTFCASLLDENPVYVTVSRDGHVKQTILQSEPSKMASNSATSGSRNLTLVTLFDPHGEYIYGGTSRGLLNVIDIESLQLVRSLKICNGTIKQIRFSHNGGVMVVNSTDRIVRTLDTRDIRMSIESIGRAERVERIERIESIERNSQGGDDCEVGENADNTIDDIAIDLDSESVDKLIEHRFQDQVNRLQWNSVAFSQSGEYVMASTFQATDVYIWERDRGSLVKILEGPKEEMTDIEWHPVEPIIVALALDTGRIFGWAVPRIESWSVFASGFRELEENSVYSEHEDEFDIDEDGDERKISRENIENEGKQVDLVTNIWQDDLFKIPADLSSALDRDIEAEERERRAESIGKASYFGDNVGSRIVVGSDAASQQRTYANRSISSAGNDGSASLKRGLE